MTFDFLRHCQITVRVGVARLEECCMASADMLRLFYSGGRFVADGPLFIIMLADYVIYTLLLYYSDNNRRI